jgi:hypothetical protein
LRSVTIFFNRTDLAATLSIRTDLSAEQQQQTDVGTSSRIRADVATTAHVQVHVLISWSGIKSYFIGSSRVPYTYRTELMMSTTEARTDFKMFNEKWTDLVTGVREFIETADECPSFGCKSD